MAFPTSPIDEEQTQVTFCFVFLAAEAADEHMQLAQAHIQRGLEITRTARLQVLGTPGPVLRQALQANVELGVPVHVLPRYLDGFTRAPAVT